MLPNLIRIFGVACLLVGILHIVLGLSADQLLGAGLSDTTLTNASLDSQNRFYGAQFLLVGSVSLYCARNLVANSKLLRLVMTVFFVGGLARLVSIAIHGWPSPMIQILLLTELALPPIILVWHSVAFGNKR